MRWPAWLVLRPEPPSAGRVMLADPRARRRRGLFALAVVAVAMSVLWPRGLGKMADEMRRDIVAAGHFRNAVAAAEARPVDRARVLADLRRALQVAPDPQPYLAASAQLMVAMRAYKEAVPLLRRAQPDRNLMSTISLAQCLMLTDRVEEGESLLEIVNATLQQRRNLPDQVFALMANNVAYAYAVADRRLDRAETLARAALQVEPLQSAYIDSLGWVLYRLGRFEEAAFYLEQAARQRQPAQDAEIYYHLGACYARMGRVQAARTALYQCLELDPSWQEARQVLERLQQVLPPPLLVQSMPPAVCNPTPARRSHDANL